MSDQKLDCIGDLLSRLHGHHRQRRADVLISLLSIHLVAAAAVLAATAGVHCTLSVFMNTFKKDPSFAYGFVKINESRFSFVKLDVEILQRTLPSIGMYRDSSFDPTEGLIKGVNQSQLLVN